MKEPFVYTMRVRFRDTDMQGHVYFGNYFVFCDEALGAYMRAIGMPWQDMVKSGTDMFYVNASCDYLGSAKFEEDVHIETRISKLGSSSVTSAFVIRHECLCRSEDPREGQRAPPTPRSRGCVRRRAGRCVISAGPASAASKCDSVERMAEDDAVRRGECVVERDDRADGGLPRLEREGHIWPLDGGRDFVHGACKLRVSGCCSHDSLPFLIHAAIFRC
ncbi:MAG: acyl-CoA thioesterase [Deltaproteobacteria bacterium]|nr:acyl-CoA thioesterase [Deltaproteobacteria bacterium]